jgi:hypothetical protein
LGEFKFFLLGSKCLCLWKIAGGKKACDKQACSQEAAIQFEQA